MPRPAATRLCRLSISCAVCVAAAVALAPRAGAKETPSPALKLAQRYVPIMEVRKQRDPCDSQGEGYRPTSVFTFLGNPDVALRRVPQGSTPAKTLARGPTAQQVAGLGAGYDLNLPGDPLNPGCDYMKLSRELVAPFPNLTYVHIAREPGVQGLTLQYWFFWVFNQFTDLHEGDWEMIQVGFPVDTVAEALSSSPSEVAYAEHAGGTRTSWTGGDLDTEGTHPIVHAAAGSHASYLGSNLYLGNGKSGFGCDDTRGPSQRLTLTPELVPTNPGLKSADAWLTFEGLWGQKEPGFYKGPGGPNQKEQWREPFRWANSLRSDAPTVPGGATFGPSATSVFCGAVTAGSKAVLFATQREWAAWLILLVLGALAVWAVRGTSWHKRESLPLGQRLAAGEVLRGARSIDRRHRELYRRVGLIFVPFITLATLCSSLLLGSDNVHAFTGISAGRGIEYVVTFTIAILFAGVAFSLLAAAVTASLLKIDQGDRPSALGAYRAALDRIGSLAAIIGTVALTTGALTITVIGIPLAIRKAVDWTFATPEAMIRGTGARDSLRASTQLVRGRWWRVAGILAVVLGIGIVSGALVGVLLISTTGLPLVAINVVASLVYVVAIPYCAIALVLERYSLSGPTEAR